MPDRRRKLLVVRGQLIKRYFITGLLIWVPLVITGWVLSMIISTLDQSLRLLPAGMHPQSLVGFAIPGAGALLTLAMILFTGLLATNFIGQKLVVWSEKILARIPVVNSVYHSVKQVSDTLFSPNGNAFRKALLIRYPHHRFPDRLTRWRHRESPRRGTCQRLRTDHAKPNFGFFPDAPGQRCHRT